MRKYLGLGQGKGYYNLVPMDSYVHSLSAKGVKNTYYQRFKDVSALRKSERKIAEIERGLATPQLGALVIRSVSGVAGLGFGAVGLTIPLVGLAVSGVLGGVYLEEKALQKKVAKGQDLFAKLEVTQRSVMWNPKTGKVLQGRLSHGEVLRESGVGTGEIPKEINEWVRAVYVPQRKTLFIRHYFNPQSKYAEFTSEDFNISERMQKNLLNHIDIPKDTKIVYNTTNSLLKQEGFIHQ